MLTACMHHISSRRLCQLTFFSATFQFVPCIWQNPQRRSCPAILAKDHCFYPIFPIMKEALMNPDEISYNLLFYYDFSDICISVWFLSPPAFVLDVTALGCLILTFLRRFFAALKGEMHEWAFSFGIIELGLPVHQHRCCCLKVTYQCHFQTLLEEVNIEFLFL